MLIKFLCHIRLPAFCSMAPFQTSVADPRPSGILRDGDWLLVTGVAGVLDP